MTASTSIPTTAEQATSLPHERANLCAMVAVEFGDFCAQVIRDNAHAAAHGLRIVNAYTNPDGREGDGSAKVKTYPTDARMADVERRVSAVVTLARLAARVRSDEDALSTVLSAVNARMAALGTLDSELWAAWARSEKAHLPGPAAALLDVDGFAWTASRKGHTAEIRYRDDAQSYNRANRSDHAYMEQNAYLSEDDMIDAVTADW